MKRDLILSAVVAVGVHVCILGAGVPQAGSVHGDIYKPIILSVKRTPKAVVPAPAVQKPPEPVSRPELSPKQKPVLKKTVISKEKLSTKKRLIAKPPVKEKRVGVIKVEEVTEETLITPEPVEHLPENSVESVRKDAVEEETHRAAEEAETPSSLETASIHKDDSPDALQTEGMAPGKGSPEGSIIGKAVPTYHPDPHYPSVAIRRGHEGKVVLEVEVLATGKVGQIKVAKSSGFEELDRSALTKVKTWTFPPGKRQLATLPITFELKDF